MQQFYCKPENKIGFSIQEENKENSALSYLIKTIPLFSLKKNNHHLKTLGEVCSGLGPYHILGVGCRRIT